MCQKKGKAQWKAKSSANTVPPHPHVTIKHTKSLACAFQVSANSHFQVMDLDGCNQLHWSIYGSSMARSHQNYLLSFSQYCSDQNILLNQRYFSGKSNMNTPHIFPYIFASLVVEYNSIVVSLLLVYFSGQFMFWNSSFWHVAAFVPGNSTHLQFALKQDICTQDSHGLNNTKILFRNSLSFDRHKQTAFSPSPHRYSVGNLFCSPQPR